MVLKNILTVLRKLASAAMNFLIVYFETIAKPRQSTHRDKQRSTHPWR